MDFAMDENGDLAVKNGDFYFVEGTDATVQFLKQKLRLFLGEWFLDESKGVPYFDEIFIKNPDPSVLQSIFISQIIETPGVLELTSFEMNIEPSTRVLSINFTARCQDGEIDFSETFAIPGGV